MPAALDALRPASLIRDEAARDLHAEDAFTAGPRPLAVFRPADIDELSAGIRAAAADGLVIVPRGGGMSYTSGYLAPDAGALVVDLSAMDRIVAVDETDMTVTVEAGCSWGALYDALHPRGLRTPLWGTLSGIRASVGGGMSQNGLFWGAGRGTIAASAVSFRVVLADGAVIDTGTGFLRPYGPDLTGLFASDAGAFGIKAHITLPLIREAEALAYGSFAFDAPAAFAEAASAVARAGLATESFGFDPFLQAQRMKRDSLAADAKALVGMMRAQGGFWRAVKEGARVVTAGRSFLDDAAFSMHFVAEGLTQGEADERMTRTAAICTHAGGRAVENTIPKVLRANPFPPVNSMLGPNGERWVPVHGIVRHSQALATVTAITALFEDHRAADGAAGGRRGLYVPDGGDDRVPDRAGLLLAGPLGRAAPGEHRAGASGETDRVRRQCRGARAGRAIARRGHRDLPGAWRHAFPDRPDLPAESQPRPARLDDPRSVEGRGRSGWPDEPGRTWAVIMRTDDSAVREQNGLPSSRAHPTRITQ